MMPCALTAAWCATRAPPIALPSSADAAELEGLARGARAPRFGGRSRGDKLFEACRGLKLQLTKGAPRACRMLRAQCLRAAVAVPRAARPAVSRVGMCARSSVLAACLALRRATSDR